MKEQIRFGSLFSGIGGFDLGFERAGMKCAWQVEIDEACNKVLEKHWPDVKRFRDVREVGKHNLESVDLICGGFPCQPHSLAGKRKASEDERDLWPDFYRVICELEPEWVVVENVRGLLSSEVGRFFGGILKDLASRGYDAEWQVLSAEAFGAPHIRERVFIVAHLEIGGIGELSVPTRRPFKKSSDVDRMGEDVSDFDGQGLSAWNEPGCIDPQTRSVFQGGELERVFSENRRKQWASEPGVGRVVHGVPHRVDRIKELGNAIVPQIPEWIGKRIVAIGETE